MKGLKGHAAQTFLEQCRVDSKGPTRCKETDHKFSRGELFDSVQL